MTPYNKELFDSMNPEDSAILHDEFSKYKIRMVPDNPDEVIVQGDSSKEYIFFDQ